MEDIEPTKRAVDVEKDDVTDVGAGSQGQVLDPPQQDMEQTSASAGEPPDPLLNAPEDMAARPPRREVVRPWHTDPLPSAAPQARVAVPPPAAAVAPDEPATRSTGKASRIEEHRDLVGVLPDAEVAKKAGVSRSLVALYRKQHGISPSQPRPSGASKGKGRSASKTRKATRQAKTELAPAPRDAAPAPRAVPAPVAARVEPQRVAPPPVARIVFGWRVRMVVGGVEAERVVLAESASAAVRVAAHHGEVVALERLSQALE